MQEMRADAAAAQTVALGKADNILRATIDIIKAGGALCQQRKENNIADK